MPQNLQKVSPAYAKSFYGVNVIQGSPLDRASIEGFKSQFTVLTSGGGTLPLDRDGDPNELDDNQPVVEQNG